MPTLRWEQLAIISALWPQLLFSLKGSPPKLSQWMFAKFSCCGSNTVIRLEEQDCTWRVVSKRPLTFYFSREKKSFACIRSWFKLLRALDSSCDQSVLVLISSLYDSTWVQKVDWWNKQESVACKQECPSTEKGFEQTRNFIYSRPPSDGDLKKQDLAPFDNSLKGPHEMEEGRNLMSL